MTILPHLYRHNRWANLTLLDFCRGLAQEQLTVRAAGSFEYGAYGCLVHLVLNEEGYYQGITGEDLGVPPFDMANIPSLPALRKRMADIAEHYIRLADEIEEDRVFTGTWQGQSFSMPAYIPLFQCINHSTEHREQAKACLTVAGLEPPTVDVWAWQEAGRP